MISSSRRPWIVAIATAILGNACPIVQPLLVGVYVDQLGIGLSTAGYLSAAELVGLTVAALLVAHKVRTLSLRSTAVVACGAFILAHLACLLAGDAITMALCRIASGCASGVALATSSAMAARTTQPDRVFALAFAGVTAYGTAFFMTVPALMQIHGYVIVFMAQALLGAMVACGVLLLGSSRDVPAQAVPTAANDANPATAARSRDSVRILACGFLLYVGHAAIWTYEERMGTRIALTPAEIGTALSIASIAGLLGALVAAGIGTRLGRSLPQIVALMLSVAAALLIVNSGSEFEYTLAACLIAASWFYGLPYLAGLASAIDPAGQRAAELQAVMNIGYATGPLLAALVVTETYGRIGWLAASCYALCLLLVLAPAVRHDREAARHGVAALTDP